MILPQNLFCYNYLKEGRKIFYYFTLEYTIWRYNIGGGGITVSPFTCQVKSTFNPFPPSVPIWHRLAKLSILILEGIIKKISYERCDYESVDEKSLS